jgi:oligoendopeptidase F
MHTYYAQKNQPYVDFEYTIFAAEVASTFNETLLSKYMLDLHKDNPKMRAYVLCREIDSIRATLYRQTMFAEFEQIIHKRAQENKSLTIKEFREIYRKLLEDYFGNTFVIDDLLELEGLRIPHFYEAFYVYKYATGVSAAISLAQSVLSKGGGEGEPPLDRYMNFLKLGGSKFPIDALRIAGVDMTKPEPVERAIRHFDSRVDELIEVYKNI